ncbi:MAG TPA: alpha/beta fold hydrolase [Acidimicrobiales bacterium]|jgi:alpha-beta hydrolase superfamily lysophospholipase|nr:alpha/beta fold hydrolase [Acidimicrobiales bacterium]
MRHQPVSFYSDRLRLDGDLYLPEDPPPQGGRWPAVVACSGYQGLKDIHPARFARALVPRGYVCLAFDYRGFGNSEGERGRLVPQDQVEDVRAGVSFLTTLPQVDPDRIALIGWALGGGVVIAAAADDPTVAGVAACNAVGDGGRAVRAMHDDDSWGRLLERIESDRAHRVVAGASEVVAPFEIVRLDLDEATDDYVDAELTKAPGFGSGVSLESADHLLRFRPELVVDRIAPRPLLLVHAQENRLHPPEESASLARRAGTPTQVVPLPGVGHTEWMFDDHPMFHTLRGHLEAFLADALTAPARPGNGPCA